VDADVSTSGAGPAPAPALDDDDEDDEDEDDDDDDDDDDGTAAPRARFEAPSAPSGAPRLPLPSLPALFVASVLYTTFHSSQLSRK
jgi:hypothetical protein